MYDEELADYDEDEDPTQSVLDRRAERRKMKRFRLTHSQTRFLMSEFTRQAHPDAAHREKLSREIPGLSPRQVQVWFQNRRAKLKRLTSDDRERMLKSRTLPADFDMTPTLHPPFRGSLIVDTPLVSPTDYSPTYSAGSMSRPLVVDTMRRYSDSNRAPNSGFGQAPGYPMYTPPASGSPSSLLSPMAVPGDRQQHASYIPSPLSAGFRSSNPFGPPTTSADGNRHSLPSIPHLQIQEKSSQNRLDNSSSPLRSAVSWKGNAVDFAGYRFSPDGSGPNDRQFAADGSSWNETLPHSRYEGNTTQRSNFQPYNPSPPLRTSTPLANANFPASLDLRDNRGPVCTTSDINSPGYHSAPLAVPNDFHLPHLSSSQSAPSHEAPYLPFSVSTPIVSIIEPAPMSARSDSDAKDSAAQCEYLGLRRTASAHAIRFNSHQ